MTHGYMNIPLRFKPIKPRKLSSYGRHKAGHSRRIHQLVGFACCLVFGVVYFGGSVAIAKTADRVKAKTFTHRSAQAGVLRGHHIVFSGHRITVPVVAVEPGAPDTTFEVHGHVDPTLIVPAGAKLHFELVNLDKGMAHGLVITRKGPPYTNNPKLPIGKTPKKSTSGVFGNSSQLLPVSVGVIGPEENSKKVIVKKSVWFSLNAGIYHYVCPIPGHAKKGMYGMIIVRKDDG